MGRWEMRRVVAILVMVLLAGCGGGATAVSSSLPSASVPASDPAVSPTVQPVPSGAPTPTATSNDSGLVVGRATHIVIAIDRLSAIVASGAADTGDQGGTWMVDEGNWVTSNLTAASLEPPFSDYLNRLMDGLSAVSTGSDFAAEAVAIIALRPAFVALSAGPGMATLAPAPLPVLTPAPTREIVKVTGTGSKNSKKFTLAGGDYAVVFSGKSTSTYGGNAILDLIGVDGGTTEYLFNEIVDGRGNWKYDSNVYSVGPGTFYMEVKSPSGSWSVVFTAQP